MLKSSLCIDLGAAFTKVAYREFPESRTHLLRHDSLNFDESRFCVPSVAARNTATGDWVFGVEPMDYRPGPKVEVFRNWKSDLLSHDRDVPLGAAFLDDASPQLREFLSFTYPHLRAQEVAVRYLRWLHDEMVPQMLGRPLAQPVEVQLCVPEFVINGSLGPLVERLMEEAGFENTGLYTLSEPKANLIGVLTEGRNVLTRGNRPSRTGMFGDSHVVSRLSRDGEAVLFVDIGAYTTDLALANLWRNDEGSFVDDPSESAPLGISLLDKMVVARLDARLKEIVGKSLTPAEWERIHECDYGGRVHFDSIVPWVTHEGARLPGNVVRECIEEFAARVTRTLQRFLDHCQPSSLRTAVLTGGGSNLPEVANRLACQLAGFDVTVLYAPESTRVPPGMEKHPLTQELVRGASGIGGASILFAKH